MIYRRDEDDPLSRVNNIEAPGRRPRGRLKKSWSDCVRGDILAAGVQEAMAQDRAVWRTAISFLTAL